LLSPLLACLLACFLVGWFGWVGFYLLVGWLIDLVGLVGFFGLVSKLVFSTYPSWLIHEILFMLSYTK
jgi:hypothetical protein